MSKTNSEKGRESVVKGQEFEAEVAAIFRLMRWSVQQNIEVCQKKVDLLVTVPIMGGRKHRIIVECKNEKRNIAQNERIFQFQGLLDSARRSREAEAAMIITREPWSDQAKGAALNGGIDLWTFEDLIGHLLDFSSYIDNVIHDFEHFNEFFDAQGYLVRTPIIEIMHRSDLCHTYIPLICRVPTEKGVRLEPLDEYVDKWLADPEHNHLSILGDFGTGKSSFCLHLTYELAKRYKADPVNSRIPLFISLRDYSKAVSLRQLITDLLVNKYNVDLNDYAAFERFLRTGKLILIFDGFDEMATKTDRALTIKNFDELSQAATSGIKTILTCRTHYFTDNRHVDETLHNDQGNELLRRISHRPSFQVVELEEFTDEQIQRLLSLYSPSDSQKAWVVIRRNLHDIARRPLLLDMIMKTLSDLFKTDKAVNLAQLYDLYTRLWIEREDWRSKMTREGKRAFMEELATHMWLTSTQSIHFSNLKMPIREYFREEVISRDDLDYYDHDTRTCSFLNRDAKGNYQFIHTSFMEFFIAKKFYEYLKQNTAEKGFGQKEFIPEISVFIAQFVSADLDALETLCRWAFDNTQMVSWNAINVLSFLKDYNPERAVDHLIENIEGTPKGWGVAWVFGELGVEDDRVFSFLRRTLQNPNHPVPWWDSAFALQKFGIVDDPVGELIKTLPAKWTFDCALNSLRKSVQAKNDADALVDMCAVISVVKEHRTGNNECKIVVEETIADLFNPILLSSDVIGRRTYIGIWLFGECKVESSLPLLLKNIHHPQSAVKNIIAEALGKIGTKFQEQNVPKEVLDALTILLTDSYYRTRVHAAESIGKIRAVSLLPVLMDACEREQLQSVQREMTKVIEELQGIEK